MDGRSFLGIAKELVRGSTEAHWRAAAGRAYYALLLEARDALQRWGFPVPPREQVHAFVRLRFTYATDPNLKAVGYTLERLGKLRNQADYHLTSASHFASSTKAQRVITEAETDLARLDKLEGDAQRRAAAIAAIRAGSP